MRMFGRDEGVSAAGRAEIDRNRIVTANDAHNFAARPERKMSLSMWCLLVGLKPHVEATQARLSFSVHFGLFA